MTLLEIVTECTKRGIPVNMGYSDGKLEYSVSGFSKSGEAVLKECDGEIVAHTRYNQTQVIESFEDLACLAHNWYVNYKNREPFNQPSPYWADTFIEYGWLKKRTVTVYE